MTDHMATAAEWADRFFVWAARITDPGWWAADILLPLVWNWWPALAVGGAGIVLHRTLQRHDRNHPQ